MVKLNVPNVPQALFFWLWDRQVPLIANNVHQDNLRFPALYHVKCVPQEHGMINWDERNVSHVPKEPAINSMDRSVRFPVFHVPLAATATPQGHTHAACVIQDSLQMKVDL